MREHGLHCRVHRSDPGVHSGGRNVRFRRNPRLEDEQGSAAIAKFLDIRFPVASGIFGGAPNYERIGAESLVGTFWSDWEPRHAAKVLEALRDGKFGNESFTN